MRLGSITRVAVMGVAAMLAAPDTSGADSATSQPGVIDSRLRTSGSAAAPLMEARSGHAAATDEDGIRVFLTLE